MKQLFFLFTLLLSSYFAQAQKEITLEEIFQKRTFSPEYIWGLEHMADGEHYTNIKVNYSTRTMDVLVYDYEKGEVQDTLFSGSWAPDSLQPFYFSSYQLSPVKDKIILAVNPERIYRYSSRADYYIFDRNNQTFEKLTNGSKQMYATFSPDGEKIAYVQDNNLFYKDLKSGKITQVTADGEENKIINGDADWVYEEELELVKAFFWSPDSRKIAFYRFDESEVKEYEFPIYKDQYPEIYRYKYPKVGQANSSITLHTYFLDRKETKQIPLAASPDEYIPRITWTHDANLLSVQKMNRHQDTLWFYLVNVKKNKARLLFTEGNPYYIDVDDDLTFLDNGKEFIWSSERNGYNHLYLYDMEGKVKRQLTTGNWDVTAFYGLDAAQKTLFYQSAEESPLQRQVYSISLKGKKKRMLTPERGTNDADFSKDCKYFLLTWSDANTPYRFAMCDARGKVLRELENNEALKKTMEEYQFVKKEFFTFTQKDGIELNGWIIKPPHFDATKKYPVFMYVYGGPGSQTVTDAYGGRNFAWFQMLAQKGYIVASVDNRGTGARGQEFKKKYTYLKMGQAEVEDQADAARYLGSQAGINASRIGIFGWSYGGYMSSLILFREAQLFALGIAVAPVSNWKYYDSIYTERYMRTYEENKEGYETGAPVNYTAGLSDPFLLVHGLADDNVHFQNSAELINSLVENEKDFKLFVYPNKAHGLGGGKTHLHLYRMMTDFLLKNL